MEGLASAGGAEGKGVTCTGSIGAAALAATGGGSSCFGRARLAAKVPTCPSPHPCSQDSGPASDLKAGSKPTWRRKNRASTAPC